jgi:glycosyltransferase involved in cell wall biosynthesis
MVKTQKTKSKRKLSIGSTRLVPDPLISIITVCKNSEKTVVRTIESVLHQTYPAIEYLVIDGASTDKTMEIVRSYEPTFQGRLRWISEKDGGIYDAMNKGINLAKGSVIGILNSDDWYESSTAEVIASNYKEHGDAVYYGILRMMENGNEVMLKIVHHQYLCREVVGHPAYFVAQSIYRKYGLYRLDYRIAADYEMMMRLLRDRVLFVPIYSLLSNFSSGGESTINEKKTIEEYLRIRCEYGYISKPYLNFRLFRMKISSILDHINKFFRN